MPGPSARRAGRVPAARADPSAERRLERLFPDGQGFVELGVGEDEWCEHPDAVGVDAGLEQQEATLCGCFDYRGRDVGVGLLGRRILDQLDRQHGAEAADVADPRPALLPGLHAAADRLAELRRAVANALVLDDVE